MRTQAEIKATLFAMTLMSEQFLFMLYHYNSYASNPIMLRSPKPMVMRDIFLTRASSTWPNPLSTFYVSSLTDGLLNFFFAWLVVQPVTFAIGLKHSIAVFIGSGFLSSFAYLFATQVNKKKLNTKYDCACTSNGAFAGFATLTLMLPRSYIPLSRRAPIAWLGVPYLVKCAYEEYIAPRFVEKREPGMVELRNWGFVGGVCFALMYATLAFRTKMDYSMLRTFYRNIAHARRAPSATAVNKAASHTL